MELAPRTESQIVNALLDVVGWSQTARDIDSSNPQLLEYWSENQSILSGIQELEQVTGSMFYIDYRGYAKWESLVYRSLNSGTPVATFNDTMHDFTYNLDWVDIFNHIILRVRPPQVPETDTEGAEMEKEWKRYCYRFISAPTVLHPAQYYQDFWAYTDEDEYASSWGSPIAQAHYFAGSDKAWPSVSIISQSRTTCTIRITNDTGEDIVIDSVSITYIPLVEDDPIDDTPPVGGWAEGQASVELEDITSQDAYTHGLPKTKEINVPFPMNYNDALNLANMYLNYYKDPVPDITQTVRNDTEVNLIAILNSVISDRITSICTSADINGDFYINKEEHRVTEGGLWHEVKWTLEKCAMQRQFFILDVSELDSGAILAPW